MAYDIYLSVVLPSYNGSSSLERNLPYLITYLKSQNFTFEIIIVDDGSDDNNATKNIALKNECIYLRNEKNKGKGYSIRKGMIEALGQYIIFTDADIPYDCESIGLTIKYLDTKEFDLVIGDRNLKQSKYFNQVKKIRNIGSKIMTFIIGRLLTGGYFDTKCGLKGFRNDAAKLIFKYSTVNRFSVDIEIIYMALKWNFDIKRIPVKFRTNDEVSSVRIVRDSIILLADIFKIIRNNYIGRYKNLENQKIIQ
jgi:dolichyl-phosphate beta-glucosyltransferase